MQSLNGYYPTIDMCKTGMRIKEHMLSNGYSVKDIQAYLKLSCPQPIYRWFKGQVLPTVDHLYRLSILFGIHMEDLIVPNETAVYDVQDRYMQRFILYYRMLCRSTA